MPSFRLRVRSTEIDLPIGELTIGRGTDCFLRIDDDLVSRRHARLIVTDRKVVFEDLGSRNGSKVNGLKVAGSAEIQLGDTFEIGAQTFQLLKGAQTNRPTATMAPHRACKGCRLLIDASLDVCPHCGTSQLEAEAAPEPAPDATRQIAASFALVSGLGDKLLALGRIDEAERMIGPRLRELLARAREGTDIGANSLIEAHKRAIKLASLTAKDEWYVFVFDLAAAARRRLDDKTLDELHANMLAHKPAAAEALVRYSESQQGEDPDTQLHRRRLEALLRFCRD